MKTTIFAISASTAAAALKGMDVQDYHTLQKASCDPFMCGQWKCQKWCSCFEFNPILESWFDSDPGKKHQVNYCFDDGKDVCNCELPEYERVKELYRDADDNGLPDNLEHFFEQQQCQRLCKLSKACGNECVPKDSTQECELGTACNVVDLVHTYESKLGSTMEEQHNVARNLEKNHLLREKERIMAEAQSLSQTSIGLCYEINAGQEMVEYVKEKELSCKRDNPLAICDFTPSQAVAHCRKIRANHDNAMKVCEEGPEGCDLPPTCEGVVSVDGMWNLCSKIWFETDKSGNPNQEPCKTNTKIACGINEWGTPAYHPDPISEEVENALNQPDYKNVEDDTLDKLHQLTGKD